MPRIGPTDATARSPLRPIQSPDRRRREPGSRQDTLRRAARAGITVPVAAALGLVTAGGTEAPLYALLGAFWLMIFTDFPGNRQNRAVGYLGLGVNGFVLIAAGTAVSSRLWFAVALTFVLGAAVTLAGVVSETMSAGQRATLLLYLWPASTPSGPVDQRLLGWAIALATCVPAALFLLPARHRGRLRDHAARACVALASRLRGTGSDADVVAAMDALHANYLATNVRPAGLTAGSQALVRVVDNLQLIRDRLADVHSAALGPMTQPAIAVLEECSKVLLWSSPAQRDLDRAALDRAVIHLRSVEGSCYRDEVVWILSEIDDAAAIATGRQVLSRRTITTAVALTGSVVAAAAAADARPVWARALGLRLPKTASAARLIPEPLAVAAIPTAFLATRAVSARNSVRTGAGLALAVAVSHLFSVQHGFWVALGAMIVLGSSALSTGTKVIRAVTGTAVGVAVGGALIAAFGVDPKMLWLLLPVAVFSATYLPQRSFAAGQAAITMTVLVILNLIAPTGWRIGLLRIEDVVLGSTVAIVASLLLWPRGATAAITELIRAALQANAGYLHAAVLRVTGGATDDPVAVLGYVAMAADRAVDDAVRHYLSETGSEADLRTPVVQAANRITRLRLTSDVIAEVPPAQPRSAYANARAVLEAHARSMSAKLRGESVHPPRPIIDEFVPALRCDGARGDAVDAALPLVTVAAGLGELELSYPSDS
ncbi:FUSC family protein [Mycobacterium sherrisii]|uniref:Fusaric acid resistance protein n=1 Tax=Mycobacterium sherrisii TaxID=243061 RepID=A0A1E3SVD7_9MYCO|nr:FUSC family protein [Mycobacterium sherrisii]MCV7032010.1 FUSC family protein [Mycobacterium sherrisii]ODR06059.1 fusaric acid resistance protein [Mycobacterium sherrisii]ORW76726.1 fusaric acid resistance protein [Mycobacterium sherrisii]